MRRRKNADRDNMSCRASASFREGLATVRALSQAVAGRKPMLSTRSPGRRMQLSAQRSAGVGKGPRTFQMDTSDREAFPNASRIVRLGDAAWTLEDSDLLQQLSDVLERRSRERQPCGLNALIQPPPRVRHGSSHVYLLYGPRVIWVDAENQIQCDIRGLVFEPIARLCRKGNLVANFGEDLPPLRTRQN